MTRREVTSIFAIQQKDRLPFQIIMKYHEALCGKPD